jgi:hypothetical protein
MNPPAAMRNSRHRPPRTALSLGKLSRWKAVSMPQYNGSVTRRESRNFQNNIRFRANLSWPDSSEEYYAKFCKDVVKVWQSSIEGKKKGCGKMGVAC